MPPKLAFVARALASLVLVACAASRQRPATAPPPLEYGVKITRALIAAHNTDLAAVRKFREEHWSTRVPPKSAEDLERSYLEQRADMGQLTLGEVQLDAEGTSALVRSDYGDWFHLRAIFEAAPPRRVAAVRMLSIPPPAAERAVMAGISDDEHAGQVDAFATRLARDDRFSGVVLIALGDSLLLAKAYGLANRDRNIPNTVETRFNIGSVNKLFTAVAVVQLAHAGRLGYCDRLARHLPGYPPPAAREVAVEHLLSHSAGLGDIFGRPFWDARARLRTPSDYVARYADGALLFAPGSRFQYSNFGYAVLGRVIEVASGETYAEYVRKHIYTPAGMRATGDDDVDHVGEGVAISYTQHPPHPRPMISQPTSAFPFLPIQGGPFGCGFSTAPDLRRFADALRGGKLIPASAIADMRRARFPMLEAVSVRDSYGYGLIERQLGDERFYGHGGGGWGTNAVFWMTDSGYTVVVLANDDPPAAERIGNLAMALIAKSSSITAPAVARPAPP